MKARKEKNKKQIKKIMFVIYSLGMGGAERVVSELANFFSKNQIEVHIVLVSKNIIKYNLDKNIKIIPLCDDIKISKLPINILVRITNALVRLFKIRKICRKINPSIVISFLTTLNIYTCIALLFTKYKVIVSERTDPRRFNKRIFVRVARAFAYNFLADGIVFQTKNAKEFFSSFLQNKSTVIGNPIKNNLPIRFNGEREKRIVAVGRLVKVKNYGLMINAFYKLHQKNKDYILEIFGQGEEKENLVNLIKQLNLTDYVFLRGVTQNVHKQIVNASLYILTSDMEGMPNSLMEAMAIGLPCISSDCNNGSPKSLIIHNQNGLLFSAGNERELLECMIKVLYNKRVSNKISTNAKKITQNYSIYSISEKWILFIIKIINNE